MNKLLNIPCKKLDTRGILPTKANNNDAGWDLYALKKTTIYSNNITAIPTGIAVHIPKGWVGVIKERSGFASTTTTTLKAGVVDSGYTGEIKIVMTNTGDYPIIIDAGTKIAQMLILPVPEVKFEEVEDLGKSDRGDKGFGSSDTPKT